MQTIMNKLHNTDLGILLVRLALGVVFINAGWLKITMGAFVIESFGSIGIPAFLAYVVMYCELIGGILLLLGIAVRYVGVVLAVIMATATVMVHFPAGFSLANGGYEYTYVLGLCALALVVMGGGKYSLSGIIGRVRAKKAMETVQL